MPVWGVVDGAGGGKTISSVDGTGWKVEEEEKRPRWWLMALVASVGGSGKRRWMLVAVARSGKVADRGDRNGHQVVMSVEIDAVNGDGGKGVEVMEVSVEETALAMFAVGCCWLSTGGLDVTALAVWVGEQGKR